MSQNPQCIYLSADTICGPEFNGYPVSGLSFANVSDFSSSIQNFIMNLDNVAYTYYSGYGCNQNQSLAVASSLRYQVSFWCAKAVQQSVDSGCAIPSGFAKMALCQNQCQLAYSSIQNAFTNPSQCPLPSVTAVNNSRFALVNDMMNTCKTFTTSMQSQNSICFNGVNFETSNCGFRNQSMRSTQCNLLPNDPCCSSITKSSQSLSAGAIAGIVIGAIAGILLLATIAYWFFNRYQRRKKNEKDLEENDSSLHWMYVKLKNSTSSIKSKLGTLWKPKSATKKKPQTISMMLNDKALQDLNESDKSMETLSNTQQDSKRTLVKAVHPYHAELEDELSLKEGDYVYILNEYDDGWALGQLKDSTSKGIFPLICTQEIQRRKSSIQTSSPRYSTQSFILTSVQEPRDSKRFSKRMSSIQPPPSSPMSQASRLSVNPLLKMRSQASLDRISLASSIQTQQLKPSKMREEYHTELDDDLPSPVLEPSNDTKKVTISNETTGYSLENDFIEDYKSST